jgi:hypothetical protein
LTFYMTSLPQRPECFDLAMDFLGGPEDDEVIAYVEALEARIKQQEENFCENLQELRGRFERVVFAARDRSVGHIELADRLIDAVVAQFGLLPDHDPPNEKLKEAKRLHNENVEAEQQDPKSKADKMSPGYEPDHYVVWQGIAYWIHPTGRALMAVPITSAFIDFSKSKHVQHEEERNSTSLRKIANFLNLFN